MFGSAAGLFVYAYCFYYYLARSEMSGFMQQAFYFGYMFMVCCIPSLSFNIWLGCSCLSVKGIRCVSIQLSWYPLQCELPVGFT